MQCKGICEVRKRVYRKAKERIGYGGMVVNISKAVPKYRTGEDTTISIWYNRPLDYSDPAFRRLAERTLPLHCLATV